jgi:multiple antibiotic resistance protein
MLNATEGKRKNCIITAIITAFIILTLFAFLGNLLLGFIGISINSFSIAGGELLFIIGVQIMSGGNPSSYKESNMFFNKGSCAVPIGTPFIAGPGAITVTTLMVQYDPLRVYFFPAITIISIIIYLIVTAIVLYYSDKLLALITEEGSNVLARIMGIVIASIGG